MERRRRVREDPTLVAVVGQTTCTVGAALVTAGRAGPFRTLGPLPRQTAMVTFVVGLAGRATVGTAPPPTDVFPARPTEIVVGRVPYTMGTPARPAT